MFEQLVTDAASRLGLPVTSVSALIRELLSFITSERTGGAEGFVDLFRRAGLGDLMTSWFGGKQDRTITPAQLETALGPNTLDRLAGASGLTRTAATSALALLLPKVIARLTPSGVLPSRTQLLSQVSADIERPLSSVIAHGADTSSGWPAWIPWAAVALVALGAFLWFRGPAGTIDPELTLSNRDGRITYSGVVRDESTRAAIVSALTTAFGERNIDGSLRVDANVKRAGWVPRLADLFAAAKRPGVDIAIKGDSINLGGWLSSGDRRALADRVRGIVGTDMTIASLGDPAMQAARAAKDKALSALTAVGTSGVSTDRVVQAMNLGVINFATGSADIPRDDMEMIRQSAAAIKRAPSGSRIEIAGHTDNTGDAASNLALSKARAESVKNALVAAGVPDAMLVTNGYGDTRPRANNDTEYGRFQNRRIEYSVAR